MQRIVTNTSKLSGEKLINYRDVDVYNKFVFIKHDRHIWRLGRCKKSGNYYIYCLTSAEVFPDFWSQNFAGYWQKPIELLEKVINSGANAYLFKTYLEAIDWMYNETR